MTGFVARVGAASRSRAAQCRSQCGQGGALSRRNPYWRAIPMRYARAHEALVALPPPAALQLNSARDLRRLRADSDAFHAAKRLLRLRASDVWAYLGGAEPHNAHRVSLRAWRRAAGAAEPTSAAANYAARLQLASMANGILLYLHARQLMWRRVANVSVPHASAVRLFEQGIVLRHDAYQPMFATPVASVLQRDRRDFWNWAKQFDAVLLLHALPPFRRLGGGRCETAVIDLPSRLPVKLFLEALFSAALSDVPYTDVLLFSTDRCTTFRVHRNEALLREAMLMVRWFEQHFLHTLAPPPPHFHKLYRHVDRLHRAIAAEVRKCEPTCQLHEKDTSDCLAPWRRRMDAWETRRSEMPFYT